MTLSVLQSTFVSLLTIHETVPLLSHDTLACVLLERVSLFKGVSLTTISTLDDVYYLTLRTKGKKSTNLPSKT